MVSGITAVAVAVIITASAAVLTGLARSHSWQLVKSEATLAVIRAVPIGLAGQAFVAPFLAGGTLNLTSQALLITAVIIKLGQTLAFVHIM